MSKRALISVSDKNGVIEFAAALRDLGFEIVSTGGTASALVEKGVPVTKVSDVTQFPEILDGRVKTLHPAIHGGILAKKNVEAHLKELADHKITPIDLVVCNLYPFVETVNKEGAKEEDIIEQIDIGGVTLLRAAAKNFESVLVIVDPADYEPILAKLKESEGQVPLAERKKLAWKAFSHTASYDAAISSWLSRSVSSADELPATVHIAAEKVETLRYGENPHQQGALYRQAGTKLPFEQLSGKELSYNNLLDVEVAYNVTNDYDEPCVCIIKHNTPCGIATDPTSIVAAYEKALASDPVSAFGSIISVNREVTKELVEKIGSLFLEVLVADSYTEEATQILSTKKKNCRVLKTDPKSPFLQKRKENLVIRNVMGGFLVQTPDHAGVDEAKWKVVTKKQPTEEEKKALAFAWLACKHVKSNAIVLVQGTATVGIGTGQPNRVDSVIQAAKRAGEKAVGCVVGSDAFFPFPDGVEEAAKAGATAVVQPGGSIRDQDVIDTADRLGIVMIFTGERHFKH